MPLTVDINQLRSVNEFISRINREKIEDIVWILNGKEIKPNGDLLADWKYIGLNNTDFIGAAWPHESDPIKFGTLVGRYRNAD